MSKGLVSVIIPVYNGEHFLREAVQSVMRQNYQNIEIVVVDDGSTDESARIAAGLNVRYLFQPNRGAPAARNRGLQAARGEVITFLDVDDLWSDDKLQLQLGHFNQDASVQIVLGHTQMAKVIGFENGKHECRECSGPTCAMDMVSASFRKSVFDKVGFFDESQRYCDDLDWFMRARELGIHILVHPEVTRY